MEENLKFKPKKFVFENVSYEVKRFRKPQLVILQNINGIFDNGINAIMGPSGSGKTTLLNLLSQRHIPLKYVKGKIICDGEPLSKTFKNESGYVVQENILVGTMTVRENIMFSASLRLPSTISLKEKKKLVEQIIAELKLKKCADSRVGTELIRGISGGQKRRCSIALELIIRPSILFLDEPTSGLDASTAINVMNILKRLAERGCTIILSIHQPRYGIFKLFDNLILLSEGKIVYQGASRQALSYFNTLGYECEPHNNPADFFLDVIEENETSKLEIEDEEDLVSQFKRQDLALAYQNSLDCEKIKNRIGSENLNLVDGGNVLLSTITTSNSAAIMTPFPNTNNDNNGVVRIIDPSHRRSKRLGNKEAEKSSEICRNFKRYLARNFESAYPTSFCNQLKTVSRRTVLIYIRNPQIIISHIIIMLAYALVLGWIYFRADESAKYGIQNRVGALYFILMNEVFISLSVIDTFIIERANFLYEVSNGFYRISVYFIAKILGDLIIMKVISTAIIAIVVYWMIGFRSSLEAYLIFIVTVFVLSSSSNSVAFFCSATFNTGPVANHLCSMIFVFMMIFGGFFVNIKTISSLIGWLKYVSVFYYANNAFLINELKGRTFCDTPVFVIANGTRNLTCITGNDYLSNQGIPYLTVWNLWSNHVGLLAINVFFWVLSYIQLWRLTKK